MIETAQGCKIDYPSPFARTIFAEFLDKANKFRMNPMDQVRAKAKELEPEGEKVDEHTFRSINDNFVDTSLVGMTPASRIEGFPRMRAIRA